MVHLSRIFGGKGITSSCLVSAGRRSAGLMGSKDEERSATELLDMHDLMFGGPSRFHSSASNHRIWKEMVSDSKHVTRKSCMLFSLHRMPMIHSLGKATAFTHFFTCSFFFSFLFLWQGIIKMPLYINIYFHQITRRKSNQKLGSRKAFLTLANITKIKYCLHIVNSTNSTIHTLADYVSCWLSV